MPSRITITDLARELSLSVCTINKALAGKPPISEATRQRVVEAANRLGYRPNALAKSMGRPALKFAAIYPGSWWPSHTRALFEGVKERFEELGDFRVEARFKELSSQSGTREFLQAIRAVCKDEVKGIIFAFGNYTKADKAKILRELDATGLPHIALGHHAGRSANAYSVWHNCRLCGELAGELLSFALPERAQTAIFIGDRRLPDHSMKIEGMRRELAAHGLPAPLICETADDPRKALQGAEKLFKSHPGVSGIYIGTENAQGVLDYLGRTGRKVKLVATGISSPVADGLKAGSVHAAIHQKQREQGRRALDLLFRYVEWGEKPASETLVSPEILLKGNLDEAK